MRVTAALMVPQTALQIIKLSVGSIRMQSTEIEPGVFVCYSEVGSLWFLAISVVVAVLYHLLKPPGPSSRN